MGFRVALLGITHESNTFVEQATTIANFTSGHLLKGESILNEYRSAFHELGGMIEVLEREDVEIIPVMYAEATPGGIVSAEAYETLLKVLLKELKEKTPVDGCLVVPHGAGVSVGFPDMDGHWLSEVRAMVGEETPIIGTLDPHANVSQLMIASTNALIAYKTNPHVDQRETGHSAAELMLGVLRGEINPVQHLLQFPLAISIEQQLTSSDPCKGLYTYAKELNKQSSVLSISILLGFPYADVEEMGSSVIVVTDNDLDKAVLTARKLETIINGVKENFRGLKRSIEDCLPLISKSQKPVLMLEMGDNVGGGSPGNSTHLLNAFERSGLYKTFICIYDPAAVTQAANHAQGEKFNITLGDKDDSITFFTGVVTLVRVIDGKFKETTPRHGGQINFDMGKIALVVSEKGNTIMLTSLRTPPFSLCQLTCFDVIPSEFDVIIAKGVNAPVAAYESVCPTIMQVSTPGATHADMTLFNYVNRRKPMYPFEEIIQ